MATILLGTVALEPNRWGLVDPSWGPTIRLSDWLPEIAAAGFDGIELWERHVTEVDEAEVAKVVAQDLPVVVHNTYVGFDEEVPEQWAAVVDWVRRLGAGGVKYNVGDEAGSEGIYAERLAAWLAQLPADVRLLCECHAGISIAEDPAVAARIFDAVGPSDRVQAIVHSNETPEHLRARFDAYGDRIGHVHVNHLDHEGGPPRLADIRAETGATIALLRELGFAGTWTVEFVHGTMTEHDEPGYLLERAVEDLAVLRDLLG